MKNKIHTASLCKHILFPIFFFGAILATGISSCTDDFHYNIIDNGAIDGEVINMPLTLSVLPIQSENPETRAVEYIDATDQEKFIHDLWVIEYNEQGLRAGKPRYYSYKDLYGEDASEPTWETGKSEGEGSSEGDNPSEGDEKSEVEQQSDAQASSIPKMEIPLIVPHRENDKYTCVVIANSNDPDLFGKDNTARYLTLDDLRCFELRTHNHEHVFDPSHNKYLLMSGWTSISKNPDKETGTWNLHIDLIRNVCKVNMRLKDFNDAKLVYKYFQWRDVPLGKAFPHGHIKYTQIISRDWKQHEDDDPDETQKREDLQKDEGIDFYIPCNVWLEKGPKMPGNDLTKTERTEDATHFTIVCRALEGFRMAEGDEEKAYELDHRKHFKKLYTGIGDYKEGMIPEESGDQYEFCLYPSVVGKKLEEIGEEKEQFDFKPNHYYKMEMNLNGLPDPEKNPLVNIIDYTYLEESNCYMMRRDSKELFAVPLVRINRFWENYDESMMLTDSTEWVAEVIWQDTPERILDFVSFKEFQVAPNKNRLEGKGWGYFDDEELDNYGQPLHIPTSCFAFRTTGAGEGNVVIGLRKKEDGWESIPVEKREYLWSWHIWITEYDPNPEKSYNSHLESWGEEEQVKKVLNGEVHKPFGNLEDYKITSEFIKSLHLPEGYPTYDNWEAPEMVEGVYIMDRNLGALETGALQRSDALSLPFINTGAPSDAEIRYRLPSFGMYYQYGRKDPFPFAAQKYQTVYDIDGKPIKAFNDPTPIHVPDQNVTGEEGDQKPTRYGETVELPENGRKDTPVTMISSKGGTFKNSVKYPYIFYTCDKVEDNWFPEGEWPLYTGTEEEVNGKKEIVFKPDDITPWCNPEWWSNGNKSIFDPCPPGWKVMDFANFKVLSGGGTNEYSSGNLYLKTGLKDLNDNIIINPIYDWTVTGKFGRNIGFALISNTDPNLYAWLPICGKRYNDTGGAAIAEGFQDHAGHSGLWLDFECALKYFTNECQFKANNESLAAGYPVRCIRDTE